MKFRADVGLALILLALIALWPFWHRATRGDVPLPGRESAEEIPVVPVTESSPSGITEDGDSTACSACSDLTRLARRFQAREAGAARRFESASNSLSVAPSKSALDPETRKQLQLALRRAQDDKRGAAAFRAATLEALEICESGAGCGEAPLARFWDEACPPEHPDLGREAVRLAGVNRRLALRTAACAAAACPEIDCGHYTRTRNLLSMADRSLSALIDPLNRAPVASRRPVPTGRLPELVDASRSWRSEAAALFLGSQDPAAQIRAAAESASLLAEELSAARDREADDHASLSPVHDPYWRVRVLSVRFERVAADLMALAEAVESKKRDRDAVLFDARRKVAASFSELLVTQMRLESARRISATETTDRDVASRCDVRRRNEIARMRGQIKVLRTALDRCAKRAICALKKGRSGPQLRAGLDPVSAHRFQLDQALDGLTDHARTLWVEAQGPVKIDTTRSRFQSGEAISVRIDLRSTACMAEDGTWVGLFPGDTPPLPGSDVQGSVIRRLNLRGRPWEEVWFEAPQRPGAYEVRTYASRIRSGAMTGNAKVNVVAREQGCDGFSGTWNSNFGRLQITVRDGEARGSYKRSGAYRAGFLKGNVKGRVLLGEWQSEIGGGGTRLVLSRDGKSFKGTWSHFRDEFAGTGIWKGTCDGSAGSQSGSARSGDGAESGK